MAPLTAFLGTILEVVGSAASPSAAGLFMPGSTDETHAPASRPGARGLSRYGLDFAVISLRDRVRALELVLRDSLIDSRVEYRAVSREQKIAAICSCKRPR